MVQKGRFWWVLLGRMFWWVLLLATTSWGASCVSTVVSFGFLGAPFLVVAADGNGDGNDGNGDGNGDDGNGNDGNGTISIINGNGTMINGNNGNDKKKCSLSLISKSNCKFNSDNNPEPDTDSPDSPDSLDSPDSDSASMSISLSKKNKIPIRIIHTKKGSKNGNNGNQTG